MVHTWRPKSGCASDPFKAQVYTLELLGAFVTAAMWIRLEPGELRTSVALPARVGTQRLYVAVYNT